MNPNIYWQAVVAKSQIMSDIFVYAVKTTGIYCRSSCSAKTPKRENVEFFQTWHEAETQGYRACKKCHPSGESIAVRQHRQMIEACELIQANNGELGLVDLAAHFAMSHYFFQRVFKQEIGITPKQYSNEVKRQNMTQVLQNRDKNIIDVAYDSGFNSVGRFYASVQANIGMTPTSFRHGGKQMQIYFALSECSLGYVLVASSHKGICNISMGDDLEQLLQDFQDIYPNAELVANDTDFNAVVAHVLEKIEMPKTQLQLPLDIQGTAFQQKVWQALMKIPVGETRNYTEIAELIGQPTAARAVAQSCANNRLAVAIPCHRVVRKNGDLSGYKWGVERKRTLLEREQFSQK
ncbi:bifunctional DNA-binding transcriptional regulator/O6-methylguanine-DNA methyltransferase Ada [Wohlfahrtiimonas populi]|uniref:bifunctional DNA-binding transcriptional regulator/O6-methylguanine-DNA methyltransferase Ada n=1 Tax=Wohlfahrtiimonas populi TaxID=1940240 RepID=UPI0013019BC5|nr:bifunctional DNA-binding transcriptional regulator/O6-methylguanine-DNA methyltransferase Ada [Wohlfahrtiimonas populi]